MCKYQNIKVTEGNEFSLLFPLKKRTYVSGVAIDEDIDIVSLDDVIVKIGNTEYASTLQSDGVYVVVPATLAKGTYDIVITATYGGSAINAAYFNALTIVSWSYQSDAEQYLAGSPIVYEPEFIIGGGLSDAELVQLKQQYQEAIEDAEQAEADAEAAKQEWEDKAAALDDVASETNATANKEEVIEAINNIDTSDLAKQGSNASATNTALLEAIGNINIDTTELAKQGSDSSISLTTMDAKLGDPVMMTADEYTPALAALDNLLT